MNEENKQEGVALTGAESEVKSGEEQGVSGTDNAALQEEKKEEGVGEANEEQKAD